MPRSAQQLAHQRIQGQSLHTLDFMHVRVGGLTLHARHAPICASKGNPAPNRRALLYVSTHITVRSPVPLRSPVPCAGCCGARLVVGLEAKARVSPVISGNLECFSVDIVADQETCVLRKSSVSPHHLGTHSAHGGAGRMPCTMTMAMPWLGELKRMTSTASLAYFRRFRRRRH